MTFIFWVLTVINVLLLLFALWAKGFRSSFGASTDITVLMILGYGIVIVASFVMKFGMKQKEWAAGVAALPVLVLFVMYLFDRK